MVYKRYNSPFEEPQKPTYIPKNPPPEPPKQKKAPDTLGFLDNLATDDIIIIALIIILLAEDKENRDVPMILTLGFLFLIQYIEAD